MNNPKLIVQTPRGSIFTSRSPSGETRAELRWKQGFGQEQTAQFTQAQMFIDSEVLRCADKYTPKRSGALIASGILGTVIGSGVVRYVSPYARRLYYNRGYKFIGAPMRGAYWFERMKLAHKASILLGARRLAGGR